MEVDGQRLSDFSSKECAQAHARDPPYQFATKVAKVMQCSPSTSPGSQMGGQAATAFAMPSVPRRSTKSQPGGTKGQPDLCSNSWRTVQQAFPSAANSGQYLATGLSGHNKPRSTRIKQQRAAKGFDTE
eukprot:CAMPEP_0194547322 /NCGR_PEP_ID=MMETSP0253-20130528/91986_1 /TAXON_ID=2966 /ORGANISM="Noctiluca scintillans" /LENGTH=128 /DNA_ID=CAMNT_0039394513 /DNA_START=150 /DNA_END=537 /DNA_ORIENTATION=-